MELEATLEFQDKLLRILPIRRCKESAATLSEKEITHDADIVSPSSKKHIGGFDIRRWQQRSNGGEILHHFNAA